MRSFFSELALEIAEVSWILFRIMIPALIVVKILEEIGVLVYLTLAINPLMALVGLPEEMGVVWATTMLTNIYTGMIVFFELQQTMELSVAQVTVLGILMLFAHAFPIEARVAQVSGVSLWFTVLLRSISGLVLAAIMFQIYESTGTLQEKNELSWIPELPEPGWVAWLVYQGQNLVSIQLIIIILVSALKVLRLIGIERLMQIAISPIIRSIGIAKEASTITIVGFTLGLSFGAGLLIKEIDKGILDQRQIVLAMSFLGLCHSVIEDTLLIMFLGAHLSGILWGRIVFSFAIIAILASLQRSRWQSLCDRLTIRRV